MTTKQFLRVAVAGGIAILLLGVLVAFAPSLPGRLGAGDFTAYWSASYLLAHGENFADPARLLYVEQVLTQWPENWVFSTWNPPWLLVMLIPYTWLPFERAAWLWMLTSMLVIFWGSIALWEMYAAPHANRRWALLMPLLAFAFPPTLLALAAGQVNLFVFAGLVGFLVLHRKQQKFASGAVLALTMVKPHIVYVTVAILLLDALIKRKWRVVGGFAAMLVGLSAIAFVLRPSLIFDYGAGVTGGNLIAWQTPTLGGALGAALGWHWSITMGVIVLPLCVLVWWRQRERWNVNTLMDVTLLVSVITAPFGWSYDFIVLLLPLLHMVVWLVNGALRKPNAVALSGGLVLLYIAMYYQRTVMDNEVQFFWVPLAIAGLYLFAAWSVSQNSFVSAASPAIPASNRDE